MSNDTTGIRVHREGAVVTVTLDRPDALNALTPAMLHALGDALDAIAADAGARVVVLTGAGRAFSAGVDLKALGQVPLDVSALGASASRLTMMSSSMPSASTSVAQRGSTQTFPNMSSWMPRRRRS